MKRIERDEHLEGYHLHFEIDALDQALCLESIPSKNSYELSCFLNKMYKVTISAIFEGVDLPDRSKEWAIVQVEKMIRMINRYKMMIAPELTNFITLNNKGMWSTIDLCFLVSCNLQLIRWQLKGSKPKLESQEFSQLVEDEVILYSKDYSQYTQMEMIRTLSLLSKRWNRIPIRDYMQYWIDCLDYACAILCVKRQSIRFMDGRLERDKIRNSDKTYSCSSSFISEMATHLHYARSFLLVSELEIDVDRYIRVVGEKKVWSGYKSYILTPKFVHWLTSLTQGMNETSFLTDLKKTITEMAGLIIGDRERFSRENGGLIEHQPMVILEHSHGVLQSQYWGGKCCAPGLKVLMLSTDPLLRSVVMAKVFHQHIFNKSKFNWWTQVVIWEKDILRRQEELIVSDNPHIIQNSGEYSVYYNDQMGDAKPKIYRTITMENAIVFWMILMEKEKDYFFTDLRFKKTKLNIIRQILSSLNDVSETIAAQVQTKKKEDIHGKKKKSVFIEVYGD